MRIATWNVNSMNARFPRVEQFLQTRDVDVILLQETKQRDQKFPFDALREMGYESAHFGLSQWNGVAILSRVGLQDVVQGFGEPEEEARVIAATCGGVRVYSCYIPNGRALDNPHYEYKLRWLESLHGRLGTYDPAMPLVVGGDFNVTPTDFDCYDPSAFIGATHVSEPEREALRRIESLGLVDITRQLNPDEPCYSWWAYRNGSFRRGWGLRIDLMYCSSSVVATATASWFFRCARMGENPQDHAPALLDL